MNYHPGLHRFAVLTACATFGLLIMGALVTSNDAGLSVPDWPLSYGSLTPPMVGGIVYEHTHRVVASVIGLLTIVLTVWLWRREERRWVRRIGYVAMAAVVVQGLLGGMTVLLKLPPVVSVFHACLAQTFFCLMVTIATVTSDRWTERSAPFREYALPAATTAVVFGQLALGAILRHAGTVNGDKAAEFIFPAFIAHLLGAGLVLIMVVVLGISLANPNRTRSGGGVAFLLFGLLVLQILLGLGSYMYRLQAAGGGSPALLGVILTASHLAGGAAMLATSLWTTLQESRVIGRFVETPPLGLATPTGS